MTKLRGSDLRKGPKKKNSEKGGYYLGLSSTYRIWPSMKRELESCEFEESFCQTHEVKTKKWSLRNFGQTRILYLPKGCRIGFKEINWK